MNWKEKLAGLYKEARALADKSEQGGLSEAETKRWDELKGEISEAKTKVAEDEQRAADAKAFREGDAFFNKGTGSAARTVTGEMKREAEKGNGEQKAKIDRRSASAKLLGSEGWKQFKTLGFRKGTNSGSVEVGSFFHALSTEQRAKWEEMTPDEQRTLVNTGAFPTATGSPSLIAPFRLPGIYADDLPELNVRSAFLNLQTDSPVIQYFIQSPRSSSAAFVSEATATGGSSGLKPEGGMTFESASTTVETVAEWMPVTNQTLEDEPQMRGIIDGVLLNDLKTAEDEAILTGNGTGANLLGLLNVSGVQALDAAYFSGAAVENAGTDWEDFDRITRARRQIRLVGRARATFVFLSPADMERLLTITDTNGQYYSGSPFSDTALSRMRGLTLIETEVLDEGTAVVGDGRKGIVFDRMQAAVTTGWIDQQFIRNQITVLAEERLAFAVIRPAAFAVVDLTSAA